MVVRVGMFLALIKNYDDWWEVCTMKMTSGVLIDEFDTGKLLFWGG